MYITNLTTPEAMQEEKKRFSDKAAARSKDRNWAKKRESISSVLWYGFGWVARLSFPVGLGLLMFFAANNSTNSESQSIKPSVASAPTATEIFNLRSKCAELGQQIMETNNIGIALTQGVETHYDPLTNRCYAELDVSMADMSKFDEYNSRTLYDGQTKEMLAHIQRKTGQRTAYLKDGGLNTTDFDAAVMKMQELMADDRKQ
jgi:hypothetical protein